MKVTCSQNILDQIEEVEKIYFEAMGKMPTQIEMTEKVYNQLSEEIGTSLGEHPTAKQIKNGDIATVNGMRIIIKED